MIALILQYKYFIVVPLTIVEGPIVMMVCGLLLKLGYFDFLPLYLTLVLSDFAADVLWYWFGFHFGNKFIRRFGKYFSITPKVIEVIEKLFHKYKDYILIGSKLTTGFGFAVGILFTAGFAKIPFRRYSTLTFLGGFIWTGFLLSIGYHLGEAYKNVNNDIGKLGVIAMILVVFALLFGIGKYFKQKILEKYS